jgi:antitoxin VapB
MGLNIKNPALEAEIRDLAAQTGESLTQAIAIAVAERRARLATPGAGKNRRAALSQIVAAITLPADLKTSRHDDLYDESGLPT